MTAGNIVAFVTACAGLLTALGTMFGAMVAIRKAREEAAAALLQAQSAADKATVEALTDTITSLQAENERLRECMAALIAKQDASQVTIENLRKSIEKLQNENRTLRQRVSDLEKENSCLRQGRVSHDNETLS
jgi:cell division protein FtsB